MSIEEVRKFSFKKQSDLLKGTTLGSFYELINILGSGSYAIVFSAIDLENKKNVAIKVKLFFIQKKIITNILFADNQQKKIIQGFILINIAGG